MPTFDLGTATTSARVAALIKDSYERSERTTLTTAQVLALIRGNLRGLLAGRVRTEKSIQREEANTAEDTALDGEVSVG